jgi:antitoxin component YwqK of YwqJK toxin-antitoxin module
MDDTLHIAEIPYESGEIRFRYARRVSDDGTKWIRHGRFVEYSKTGQVLSEGEYVDGLEQGLWRDFFPNGQLAAEGHYVNGQESGIWRFWNEDGSPERAVEYGNGNPLGEDVG